MSNAVKRYLLDTHVLLWLVNTPEKLSKKAQRVILDKDNQLFYSLISMNEIAIKASIGKLDIVTDWQTMYQQEFKDTQILTIDMNWQAVTKLQKLPFHHKDPFDRMLIAQAMASDLSFISADKYCHAYDLDVLW